MANTVMHANATAAMSETSSIRFFSPRRPRFQLACTPNAKSAVNGTIDSMKVGLKYGAPTESVPSPRASEMSGAMVPANTVAAAMTSRMLLKSRKDSRALRSKPACDFSFGARQAYSDSAPPIMMMRKTRMKMPRRGSAAKECTETRTPERTRKVPNKLNENASTASSSVQLLKSPRLSVTAREWMSAVPTSHGMNEAFSTGSQNQ